MNIKAYGFNVVLESKIEFIIEFNDRSTLTELKNGVKLPNDIGITFETYYDNTNCLSNFNNTLPYIINKNDKVKWNIDINSVIITDFINTHHIKQEDGIIFEYGYPQAGGPGLKIIIDIWEAVYPYLQIIATIEGVRGFLFWINNTFHKKPPIPHDVCSFLYKRGCWNHYELAELLDITKEEAKNMLILFGYKWNSQKKIYIIESDKKKEMIDKMKKINFLDIK